MTKKLENPTVEGQKVGDCHPFLDFYVITEESITWPSCPKCVSKPFVWTFDNGRYARCCCFDTYSYAYDCARAESIMSTYSRCGSLEKYDFDELKNRWDRYIETGEVQIQMNEGRW